MSAVSNIPENAKIYLNKPYVQLYWDPSTRILTSHWSGFCTFDEIVAVGKRILDAVTFEHAEKVLYDARDIEVLDDQSQRYISGDFTRAMVNSGVKYAATVFPEDVFAKFSIDDIKENLSSNRGTSINYFNTISTAFNWLQSK